MLPVGRMKETYSTLHMRHWGYSIYTDIAAK